MKIINNLKRYNKGFTLLELLIVLIIIGLLAALVGPKLIHRVGEAKQKTGKVQIEMLSTSLDTFRLDTGKYPDEEQGLEALITNSDIKNWKGPYLKKKFVPKDPWGNDYIYKYDSETKSLEIISYGADATEGGKGDDADISSNE
ncbi:MAG: type II secretion system major pseudopilin GspG [Candidatus Anammoxibacter sp.]